MPISNLEDICIELEKILKIKCNSLPNHLNITLTPSNPILHTTRLATLFSDYKERIIWEQILDFYGDWNDDASELLILCDKELQMLCDKMVGLDMTGVKSLKTHYESDTPEEMTRKIRSIIAFKDIKSPMIKVENGYIPDIHSRYLEEDFSYGLCIIKGFCKLLNIDSPYIDKVLMWFEKVAGVEYYVNGEYIGKDLELLPLPQNYSLNNLEDLVKFYTN